MRTKYIVIANQRIQFTITEHTNKHTRTRAYIHTDDKEEEEEEEEEEKKNSSCKCFQVE